MLERGMRTRRLRKEKQRDAAWKATEIVGKVEVRGMRHLEEGYDPEGVFLSPLL
jgi:hypothetical protein